MTFDDVRTKAGCQRLVVLVGLREETLEKNGRALMDDSWDDFLVG